MESAVRLYYFYRTAAMRTARLVVFLLLFVVIILLVTNHQTPKFAVFVFNLFVMFEVFFHYKISKMEPQIPLEKSKKEKMFESFTMPALYGFIAYPKTSDIIKYLLTFPQIQLLMQKANIQEHEIVLDDVALKLLLDSTFDTAQTLKGKYISTLDVFVAYLFLIESDTKLLFAKQLKIVDFYNIIYWVRSALPEEENPKKMRVQVTGAGIGEALSGGWTPETKKYTVQFTSYALKTEPLITGREKDFRLLLEALNKIENNNVLLVGDTGAGKENLVRALAYHSFEGNIGGYLNYKRVLQLLVGALIAGTGNRSDLEMRLQDIIAELSHAGDIFLYIPEFQNILGASAYGIDLSGALLPYLKNGNMPIIATMTTGTYKTFMDKNPLKEVFTIIKLEEPEQDIAIQMVLGDVQKLEEKYRVIVSYRALLSAIELANRFVQDQMLPGSAITVLDNVANVVASDKTRKPFEHVRRKMVLEADVVAKVEETSHVAIALPTGKEIELLLHLEDRLHEKVIDQDEAINVISEAMRRVRSGMTTSERPMSFLFLGPTGVGKTETAKALASYYFEGEENMIRLDMSEYADDDGVKRLLGAPPGQGDERGELTDQIHDNPASLVLLDEFEKASPKIHNLFLQVLDDGRLTDNKGNTVSFRNAIIIATSNAGAEFIREAVKKKTTIDKKFQHQLLEYLQSKGIFKPELLNRFDDVVTFKPLGAEQIRKVAQLMLQELMDSMDKQDITVTFDEAVIEKIVSEGFDEEFGARPLRRYLQDTIEDLLAQKKLTKEIERGKKVLVTVDGTGAFKLTIS